MTLRTNSKEFWKRFGEYFIDCINAYDFDSDDLNECIAHFWETFDKEYNYPQNKKIYPVLKDRIDEFLRGLPFGFAFTTPDIIDAMKTLGTVDGTTPVKMLDKYVANWWQWLVTKITQLSERNGVDIRQYV